MSIHGRKSFSPKLQQLEDRTVLTGMPMSADPVPSGQSPTVTVHDAEGEAVAIIDAYEPEMTAGVRVEIVDVTGDGVPDIVTAPLEGGGPRLRVFDGISFTPVFDEFVYDEAFRGGIRIAAGEIGGGEIGLVTGAGEGGGPHVRVLTLSGAVITEFFAGDPGGTSGVEVALKTDADGRAIVVAGVDRGLQTFDPRNATPVPAIMPLPAVTIEDGRPAVVTLEQRIDGQRGRIDARGEIILDVTEPISLYAGNTGPRIETAGDKDLVVVGQGTVVGVAVTIEGKLFVQRFVNGQARYLPIEYVLANADDFDDRNYAAGDQFLAYMTSVFTGGESFDAARLNEIRKLLETGQSGDTTIKALYGYEDILAVVEHIEDLFVTVGTEIVMTVGGGAAVTTVGKFAKVALEKGFTLAKDAKGVLRVINPRTGREISKADYEDLIKTAATSARGLTGCFVAGTMIHTPGGLRAIETVRVGDEVETTDENAPDSGVVARRVAQVFRQVAPAWTLSIGGRDVTLTPEHPVFEEQRGWVPVRHVAVGSRVRGRTGEWHAVEGVRPSSQSVAVYNIEVEEFHTFYVGGDGWGFRVWVHNDALCNAMVAVTLAEDALKLAPRSAEALQLVAEKMTLLRAEFAKIPASDYFKICQNDRGAMFGQLYRLGIVTRQHLGIGAIKLTPAEISKAERVARAGDITKLDILMSIFKGSKPSDWTKKKTVGRVPEIHWYEGPGGIKVDMKRAGEHDRF